MFTTANGKFQATPLFRHVPMIHDLLLWDTVFSLQVYHCSEPTNSPIFSTGSLSKETKTYNSKLWSINSSIPVCQIPVCSCLKVMLNHQNWMQPAWNPVLTTSMYVCGTKYPQFVLDKIPTCCEMISVHLVILVLMDNILVYQYDSLT
jgi:hypothetical protein